MSDRPWLKGGVPRFLSGCGFFQSHRRSSTGDAPLSARSHIACVSNPTRYKIRRLDYPHSVQASLASNSAKRFQRGQDDTKGFPWFSACTDGHITRQTWNELLLLECFPFLLNEMRRLCFGFLLGLGVDLDSPSHLVLGCPCFVGFILSFLFLGLFYLGLGLPLLLFPAWDRVWPSFLVLCWPSFSFLHGIGGCPTPTARGKEKEEDIGSATEKERGRKAPPPTKKERRSPKEERGERQHHSKHHTKEGRGFGVKLPAWGQGRPSFRILGCPCFLGSVRVLFFNFFEWQVRLRILILLNFCNIFAVFTLFNPMVN